MHHSNRLYQKLIFLFYVILVITISTLPSSVIKIGQLWKYDKIIHFTEYLILGFLFLNCFSPFDYLPKVVFTTIFFVILFSGIDEFIVQKYFANSRVPDYFDWIADIFGASSGIGLRYFIGFKLK